LIKAIRCGFEWTDSLSRYIRKSKLKYSPFLKLDVSSITCNLKVESKERFTLDVLQIL